ncbi:SH3 domain-containing protein [Qipengyuania sp. ASV99]|uniref:SH3 domain-containing protein n=1 Tax=Qipengyuania sp. ASV99 TaxID=3399681 RepID=UPI003A4C7BDE
MVASKICASLRVIAAALALTLGLWAGAAYAQDREAPYWASLRFDEVNMRAGPSQDYPIEWVYRRKGMPVRVVRLREGWRLVEDPEGTQGWIERSQLSTALGAMIIGEGLAELRAAPTAASPLRWRAEPGVVAALIRCREGFCEIEAGGRTGWVVQDRLWGAGELEVPE